MVENEWQQRLVLLDQKVQMVPGKPNDSGHAGDVGLPVVGRQVGHRPLQEVLRPVEGVQVVPLQRRLEGDFGL